MSYATGARGRRGSTRACDRAANALAVASKRASDSSGSAVSQNDCTALCAGASTGGGAARVAENKAPPAGASNLRDASE